MVGQERQALPATVLDFIRFWNPFSLCLGCIGLET